ncbi:glycerol-3-phosphate 1-O-acyltransferase PlsY [Kamptonema cortianum]|nr:glycerol-3-phosphate 1-O-acyltransferase PlsY [Geitlerinema splendidum]MDK3155875.1 glycerol-3-phosphate 1-O-acyltransferase PlsY [Kamptonema cortianum]
MEFLLLLGSYLLGSIPFGYLLARAKGVNLLEEGSGGTGATNVGRVLGKKASAIVLTLDVLKGAIPAVLAQFLFTGDVWGRLSPAEFGLICGCVAVIGHSASPFLKFRGGKGVATGLGMLVGSFWPVAVAVLAVFILSMLLTRIVSLSSLLGTITMMISGVLLTKSPWFIGVYLIVAITIFYRHRSNIGRLLKGEEKKFSFGGRQAVAESGGDVGDS